MAPISQVNGGFCCFWVEVEGLKVEGLKVDLVLWGLRWSSGYSTRESGRSRSAIVGRCQW